MGKIYFLLGGARSGKSQYSEELAASISKDVGYLATAEIIDEEMEKRIEFHRQRRPGSWLTFEIDKDEFNIEKIEEIASIAVDWENETVNVVTRKGFGISSRQTQLPIPTLTSGCGQGTLFDRTLDSIYRHRFSKVRLHQSTIFALLKEIGQHNRIYKIAGSVHACGLCQESTLLMLAEHVGRHNAADVISGRMCIDGIPGEDKI